jgi:hypothetical protein
MFSESPSDSRHRNWVLGPVILYSLVWGKQIASEESTLIRTFIWVAVARDVEFEVLPAQNGWIRETVEIVPCFSIVVRDVEVVAGVKVLAVNAYTVNPVLFVFSFFYLKLRK